MRAGARIRADGGLTARWPRRGLLLAALAIVALLAAAVIDHELTADALPAYDSSPAASDPEGIERQRLSHDYGIRAWIYTLAMIAAVAALTVAALRSAAPGQRRELFNDLGIAGVVSGLVCAFVSSDEPSLIASSNNGTLFLIPPAALLISAAAGNLYLGARTLSGRRSAKPGEARVEGTPPSGRRTILPISLAAVGLTALTLVLVSIGHSGRECGTTAPGWSDATLWLALTAGGLAALCGIVALAQRRWVAALISIPAPLVGLFSVLVAACLS